MMKTGKFVKDGTEKKRTVTTVRETIKKGGRKHQQEASSNLESIARLDNSCGRE